MLLNFQTDLQPETPRGGAGCFQSMSQMRNIDFSYQHQYSWKHLCYGAAKRWIFVLWFMPFIAVVSRWGRVSKSVTTLIPLTNEPNSNKDLVLWESLGWSLPLMGSVHLNKRCSLPTGSGLLSAEQCHSHMKKMLGIDLRNMTNKVLISLHSPFWSRIYRMHGCTVLRPRGPKEPDTRGHSHVSMPWWVQSYFGSESGLFHCRLIPVIV